jgi:type I restriction enzyme S subunit
MNKIEKLIEELCADGVPLLRIDDHIGYEQPTKYIVSTTSYSDDYQTPVLTAGQTFLLGYTDEKEGIFEASVENPVIIFDDFTTAFKWVDFRFKVKSSAMKILKPRNNSRLELKFLFHYMSVLNYSASEHARHWISVYSQFKIPSPPLIIQREIISILDKFTDMESQLESELSARRSQLVFFRAKLLDFKSIDSDVTQGAGGS